MTTVEISTGAERATPQSIFESADALEHYLEVVRARREARSRERYERDRRRAYLAFAAQRIDAELAECDPADPDIAAELRETRARLFEMLDGRAREIETARPPAVIAAPVQPAGNLSGAEPPADESLESQTAGPLAPPDNAAAEQHARILAHLEALGERWREQDRECLYREGREWNRPACLRLRALTCEAGALSAEARAAGLAGVERDVRDLYDKMILAKEYAGDSRPCPPFDEAFWSGDSALSANVWRDLGALYERTAEAQCAMEYVAGCNGLLNAATREGLLNAIGACQQMLFRAVAVLNSSDRFQCELYQTLMDTAKAAGIFIETINQSAAIESLQHHADRLDSLLVQARTDCESNRIRQEKRKRRDSALRSIETWFASGGLEMDAESVCGALFPLLDECISAGVPPTNAAIRNALLAPAGDLLAGIDRYASILRAVRDERKRRGMAESPEAAPPQPSGEEGGGDEKLSDEAAPAELAAVTSFTRGKRILILGGTPRQRVEEELGGRLECEVKWAASKKSDRAVKFESEIRRSHILLLVKNYAGHDMSEKGREWIKAAGGHFILLPSGYGINQVIHQLFGYVQAGAARK